MKVHYLFGLYVMALLGFGSLAYASEVAHAETPVRTRTIEDLAEELTLKIDKAIKSDRLDQLRLLLHDLTVQAPMERMTVEGPKPGQYRLNVLVAPRLALDRNLITAGALIEAIREGKLGALRVLVDEYKADVNAKRGKEGRALTMSPLEFAESLQEQGLDRAAVIAFLKQNGAQPR